MVELAQWNIEYPTEEFLKSLSQEDLDNQILEGIEYTQYINTKGLEGLVMEFRNG